MPRSCLSHSFFSSFQSNGFIVRNISQCVPYGNSAHKKLAVGDQKWRILRVFGLFWGVFGRFGVKRAVLSAVRSTCKASVQPHEAQQETQQSRPQRERLQKQPIAPLALLFCQRIVRHQRSGRRRRYSLPPTSNANEYVRA